VARIPWGKIVELSHHQTKPNPTVLLEICGNEAFSADNTAYVGDSIARDVLMAKRAKVYAIWAAYGARHDPGLYRSLVRISHWTADEVAREQKLKDEARQISPDYIARRSFSEVLIPLSINEEISRMAPM
jgi:FMN phosphatase YigB (HAD superfamily)